MKLIKKAINELLMYEDSLLCRNILVNPLAILLPLDNPYQVINLLDHSQLKPHGVN